ncbi:lytic transglycosylase domain-containing protein [Vannielia litorea]|uniref:Transglycosylase SLT domain-containing protein n=1 Tax=Vannielia litorea TaxID=1217970 RepID=A0A1N6EAW8_9RHOB|nr:lytic transglycosylase domain-containing protein [Vannielia litorea]SIN80169.1 Transglycosylase SLT domain-containing protein [Vannielia litorea]
MRQMMFAGLAAAGVCLSGPSWAETSGAYPDFTFKRVKAGKGLPGKRITVQIDPKAQAEYIAARPNAPQKGEGAEPAVATAGEGEVITASVDPVALPDAPTYGWFWTAISPDLSAKAPGRLDAAVQMLSNGPEGQTVKAPRLSHMKKISDKYGAEILKATIGTDVSPALVLAVIGIESSGNVTAVSSAGAQGLMQLMPDTAARFGVTDSNDPVQNIKGGVAYLDFLMKEFDRDPMLVLAGYNAGEGAVKKNSGVPPYAETRDYVPKVLAAWTVARGLCLTPPQLVTDGCVFAGG